MLTDRLADNFDDWLDAALQCSISSVRTFAESLQDEYDFIQAAMDFKWSNGPTEGHVNRLKFIKRQMYERASFELLRHKVLCPPGST